MKASNEWMPHPDDDEASQAAASEAPQPSDEPSEAAETPEASKAAAEPSEGGPEEDSMKASNEWMPHPDDDEASQAAASEAPHPGDEASEVAVTPEASAAEPTEPGEGGPEEDSMKACTEWKAHPDDHEASHAAASEAPYPSDEVSEAAEAPEDSAAEPTEPSDGGLEEEDEAPRGADPHGQPSHEKRKTMEGSAYEAKGLTVDEILHRHARFGYDPIDRAFQREVAATNGAVDEQTAVALLEDHLETMRDLGLAFTRAFERQSLGFRIAIARYGDDGRQFVEVDETLPHCEWVEDVKPTDEVIAIDDALIVAPSEATFGAIRAAIRDAPRPVRLTFVQGENRDEAYAEQQRLSVVVEENATTTRDEQPAAREPPPAVPAVVTPTTPGSDEDDDDNFEPVPVPGWPPVFSVDEDDDEPLDDDAIPTRIVDRDIAADSKSSQWCFCGLGGAGKPSSVGSFCAA
mmetsp:Transcript_26319/g.105327  ORF Transcript_26319/g.105327 Transcript_26319/m.105327 type:complete len:462 (+) Transcript_26319:24-1409(+)